MKSLSNAFSLMELIFLIVIIGILAAVAIPQLNGTGKVNINGKEFKVDKMFEEIQRATGVKIEVRDEKRKDEQHTTEWN